MKNKLYKDNLYKNKLYTYNRESLSYEPLPPCKEFAYRTGLHVSRICFVVIGVLVIAIAVVAAVLGTEQRKCDARVAEVTQRCAAVADSARVEMTIERDIARYYMDGSVSQPTADSVRSLAVEVGAWYPDVIVSQFVIESASGTSVVAQNAHNLFGMKKVRGKRSKYTTQEKHAEYNTYGMYKNWQLSVIDRVMYERFYFSFKKPSRAEYMSMLNAYAEDPEYQAKIDSVCRKQKR